MQRFLTVLFIFWSSSRVFAQLDRFYIRGDSNADGVVDIADASFTLNFLFLGGPRSVCFGAADADGNDVVDITDPILTLTALFLEPNQRIGSVGSTAIGTEDEDFRCLFYPVAQLIATPNSPQFVSLPGEVGADLGCISLLGSEPLTVKVERVGITFRTNIVTEEPAREIFLASGDGKIIAGPFRYALDIVNQGTTFSPLRRIVGHVDLKGEVIQLHVKEYEKLRVFATLSGDLEEKDGIEIVTTASSDLTATTDKGQPVVVGRTYEISSGYGRVSRYRYQVRRAGEAQNRTVVSDGVTEHTLAAWEVEAEGAHDAEGIVRLVILPNGFLNIEQGLLEGLKLYANGVFVTTLKRRVGWGLVEYEYYAKDQKGIVVLFNNKPLLTLEIRGTPAPGVSGELALSIEPFRAFGPIDGIMKKGYLNHEHFIVDEDNKSGTISFVSPP